MEIVICVYGYMRHQNVAQVQSEQCKVMW